VSVQVIKHSWQYSIPFLEDVVKAVDRAEYEEGGFSDGTTDNKVRRSKIKFLDDPIIKDVCYGLVMEQNMKHWGFDISRECQLQYTEYHADDQGFYDWHVDHHYKDTSPYHRKISMTIQLSYPFDYEGGDFQTDDLSTDQWEWMKFRGTAFIFPSTLRHRVKPVTRGVRKSLVAWFLGPRWR